MNIYAISGIVEYIEIGECDCCGQDTEKEREEHIRIEIEAEDENAVIELALPLVRDMLQANDWTVEIDDVVWRNGKKPTVQFVREISEAEKLKRIGAPMLF